MRVLRVMRARCVRDACVMRGIACDACVWWIDVRVGC